MLCLPIYNRQMKAVTICQDTFNKAAFQNLFWRILKKINIFWKEIKNKLE